MIAALCYFVAALMAGWWALETLAYRDGIMANFAVLILAGAIAIAAKGFENLPKLISGPESPKSPPQDRD